MKKFLITEDERDEQTNKIRYRSSSFNDIDKNNWGDMGWKYIVPTTMT